MSDANNNILRLKIEQAKAAMPEESRLAVSAVDWKPKILAMRQEKGYSFAQLEALETRTEMLLCGLLNTEEYPTELSKSMGIDRVQAGLLIEELNEKIFGRIREELVKIIERKKSIQNKTAPEELPETLETRDEILKEIQKTDQKNATGKEPFTRASEMRIEEQPEELGDGTHPILMEKLAGMVEAPKVESDHSLPNVSPASREEKAKPPTADPYREAV